MSVMDDNPSQGQIIPDYILLLSIFEYLNSAVDLGNAGLVCKSWHRVSLDELLWKRLLCSYWSIPFESATLPNENSCWKDEYVRLVYHVPIHETQKLTSHTFGHTEQVIHLSFSHDGSLFCSCSKDNIVKVWKSTFPVLVKYQQDMSLFLWVSSLFSQFNDTDTLLLVSGIRAVHVWDVGEIAVFSFDIEVGLVLQCKIRNDAITNFGAWYSDSYLISSDLNILSDTDATYVVWLNNAFQEKESEDKSVTKRLYKFYNKNASTIRFCCFMFANCTDSSSSRTSNGEIENDSSDENSSSVDDEYEMLEDREKYLIFGTGSKTSVCHEIGFKRIKPVRLKRKISLDSEKRSAKVERKVSCCGIKWRSKAELENNNVYRPPPPNWSNESQVENTIDKIDHRIDLEGQILGISLSPDHKFLYVNCRAWSEDAVVEDPYDPLPLMAQEIIIHVIDMATLKEVRTRFSFHKACSTRDECDFNFLNVSDNYVASGAEDKCGYLWDRHYKVLISKLKHSDVVNCVAFNPRDEEMLITASNDCSIKVWRSKCSLKTIRCQRRQEGRERFEVLNN